MGTERRKRGDETWNRLLHWTDAQKSSERLAAHILDYEGFTSIDPSHPLGGPDGLKDIVCIKDGIRWIASAYFPNGKQSFNKIKSKFVHDIKGVVANHAQGCVFVTNQVLTISQREKLKKLVSTNNRVEIYHLERIAHILDKPDNYGVRSEFLDIEMTKEEQLAFFARTNRVSAPDAHIKFWLKRELNDTEPYACRRLHISVTNQSDQEINHLKLVLLLKNIGRVGLDDFGVENIFEEERVDKTFSYAYRAGEADNLGMEMVYQSKEVLFPGEKINIGGHKITWMFFDDLEWSNEQWIQYAEKTEWTLQWTLYADNMPPKNGTIMICKLASA